MNILLILAMCLMATPVWAQSAPTAQIGRSQEIINDNLRLQSQIETSSPTTRIKAIVVEGFLLKDTKDLEKMLAAYKNKNLSQVDFEAIARRVEDFYVQAGYSGLVEVKYKVQRRRLIITVSLLN